MKVHRRNPASDLAIYGVEKTDETGWLWRMNLAVHGLEGRIFNGGDCNGEASSFLAEGGRPNPAKIGTHPLLRSLPLRSSAQTLRLLGRKKSAQNLGHE